MVFIVNLDLSEADGPQADVDADTVADSLVICCVSHTPYGGTTHTHFGRVSKKYRVPREEGPGGAFGAANESALTENQSLTA